MISLSLIEPPGCTTIFIPALTNNFNPSAKGKKASEAAIELIIFFGWNFLAFWIAILQLSTLLGCPPPIPIVEKLLHNTIALDFTYLLTLKANSISASSFLFGFSFVTHLKSFLFTILLFLFWTKKEPLKDLIDIWFLYLKLDVSMILKFFFLFKIFYQSHLI